MKNKISRAVLGMLVFAAVVLVTARSWATYYQLPASKDEWGLKYDVTVNDTGSDTMTVKFTLANEGRLKPIYSIELIAFSRPDYQGGRTYELKSRFELKPTQDGRREATVQMPRKFADRAMIRILTLTVDGRPQTAGAAYYDISLKQHLNKAATPPSLATPGTKVTK